MSAPLTIDITQMMKIGIIHFFHLPQAIRDGPLRNQVATTTGPKTSAVVPKTI
jgi:hypothetical protein